MTNTREMHMLGNNVFPAVREDRHNLAAVNRSLEIHDAAVDELGLGPVTAASRGQPARRGRCGDRSARAVRPGRTVQQGARCEHRTGPRDPDRRGIG